MKLTSTSRPPKPSKDRLLAFLVSDSNLEAVRNFVKENYGEGMEVEKRFTEKGYLSPYLTSSENFLFVGIGEKKEINLESIRRGVNAAVDFCNDRRLGKMSLVCMPPDPLDYQAVTQAQAETVLMANYQFLPYKTDKKENRLKNCEIYTADKKGSAWVKRGDKIGQSTNFARDLVNEPVITLTAEELASRAQQRGEALGIKVEVLNKAKIKSLKMGGLLSVNLGSVLPPTFTIMEWKPAKARNKKPVVLVGKGVVYDTGGLSLKPTQGSMDLMKSDMAGAAATIATICGVAALELPVHVIALIPATDNRPGQNAYTPGDVIRMFDGSTVEVMNTDAEGRMILADALAYAKKYKPGLVIDLATLTGAQVITLGTQGAAMMATAPAETRASLQNSGSRVHERVVELPLWEEYREQLKSDIADMKNIGGRAAGSITAGKFLEHFTDYPWIHLDIAGPAFLPSADGYRPKNGTGFGVRLLLDFLEGYQE